MSPRYSSDEEERHTRGDRDRHDAKRRRLSGDEVDGNGQVLDRQGNRGERGHRHEERSRRDKEEGRRDRDSTRHRRDHSHSLDRDKDDSKSHRRHRSHAKDHDHKDSKAHRRHRSRSRDRHSRSTKNTDSDSRHHKRHSTRHGSRSRSPKPHSSTSKRTRNRSPSPFKRSRGPLPSQADSFNQQSATGGDPDLPPAEHPNFGNTGLLAKASNRVDGTDIVLKYNEPSDARQPNASTQDWRLFIFKDKNGTDGSGAGDDDLLDTVPLAHRSCWLLGREKAVVDLHVEHPSASKQHAVIQFRYVTKTNEYGEKRGKVKPYLIDLESGNGTILNGERIGGRRFVEVRSGDVMQIGSSRREYVFVLPPRE